MREEKGEGREKEERRGKKEVERVSFLWSQSVVGIVFALHSGKKLSSI